MKKLYLITFLLMAFAMAASAQDKKMKIAVMDFKAGVGVNADEVEGLSDMLINTLFETKKFSIVERSQLYEVLKEQNLQGELTVQQCVKVGRILGVESVLIGTVNFLAEQKTLGGSTIGEYNVDIRAVDVESGEVVTTAGGTKTSGSTYRAMMEKIARQLAENLTGDAIEIQPVGGLITKGRDFYYLDGKRLTSEQYMELIQNCPEAWASYERGRRQIKTGTILLISIAGTALVGTAIGAIIGGADGGVGGLMIGGIFVGVPLALTAVPFYIAGSSKKKNAYKVYNEYCSKPTASLSFGPATTGMGVGIYLNF
ncbi:MAG: CsgG/HfaB family protein [Bacteroidales bacterium]|nr:CsgG/HfaB family protein [Bacteroidales bacterium]